MPWPKSRLNHKPRPLSIDAAVKLEEARLNASTARVKLHAGYYSQSLTAELARLAQPVAYVDINCDLYLSTSQVLDWLLHNRLLRAGSLVGYDDWFETPFLMGGESMAHWEATYRYKLHFEFVPHEGLFSKGFMKCRSVLFRLVSVGVRAVPGITPRLANQSCFAQPQAGGLSVARAVPYAECLRLLVERGLCC